jgi:fibronectin-binding autotransporter adhesin
MNKFENLAKVIELIFNFFSFRPAMYRHPLLKISALLVLSCWRAEASTFTVTTTTGDTSAGSLGAAITGTAASATSQDTVGFSAAFNNPQSITLTSSYATVTKNLGTGTFSLSAPALLTLNDGGFNIFTFSGGGTFSLGDLTLKGTGKGLSLGSGTTVSLTNVSIADAVATANSNLSVASSNTSTISGKVTGGGLAETGSGTLVLSNTTNTYFGGTGISGGGAISVSNDGNLGSTSGGGISLNNGTLVTTTGITTSRTVSINSGGGTISVSSGQTSTFSGQISGFGKLTASGAGTLVLSNATNGSNLYAGGTAITGGGVLSVASSASLGSGGGLSINGSTLQLTGAGIGEVFSSVSISNGATVNVVSSAGNAILDSASGSGGLNVTGSGTVTLADTNTFTGGIAVTSATLAADRDYQLGDASNAITLNGGTLATSDGLQTSRAMTLGANGGTVTGTSGFSSLSGTIGGSGSLTASGLNLELSGTANGYSGGTVVTGGAQLSVASDASLGASTGGITLNNGSLVGSASSPMMTSRLVTLGSGGGTVSSGVSQTIILAGKVTGTGGLKIGGGFGGTVALSGTGNDYSGGTVVNFGYALLVQNGASGSATGSGELTVGAGATLGGAGSIHASSFTFQGGSKLIAGNGADSTSQTTLTGTAASTITSSTLAFNLGTGAAQGESNTLNLGSTPVTFASTQLALNLVGSGAIARGTDYTLISLDDIADASGLTYGSNGQITGGLSIGANSEFGAEVNGYTTGPYAGSYLFVDGDNIDVAVVPEPVTWWLVLAGLPLLALRRRAQGHRVV